MVIRDSDGFGGGGDDGDYDSIKELHSPLWRCALLTSADHCAVTDHIWAQLLLLHGIKARSLWHHVLPTSADGCAARAFTHRHHLSPSLS